MTQAYRTAHLEAVARRRRIILNNDGNEPVINSTEASEVELLKYRTSPLPGSQVDTLFYCTWSSGFSLFTHLTKLGQLFTAKGAHWSGNKMQAFADAGIDPLEVMCRFAHDNSIEFFWSMRMNDVHDGHPGTDYADVMFAANNLKNAHPEFLLGSREGKRPRYGSWSAVDFAQPEIRELAFRFIEEVCQTRDVDGVEMDFYRHPVFFRGPSRGFPAGQIELDLMTSLIRRVRQMCEVEGQRRGRPLLLAVRVPDSVSYCRKVGLDVERWLAEGLIDLLVPAGYLKLNRWNYSVQLGHRYGVPVYPALDESRVTEEGLADILTGTFTKPRGRLESYRARAMNVWHSGADGVYLYNFFDPKSPMLHEIGDPQTLRGKEKQYFVSVRGVGQVAGTGFPHEDEMRLPTLNPDNPTTLFAGRTETVELEVGEAVIGGEAELQALVTRLPEGARVDMACNGVAVKPSLVAGGWLSVPVAAALRLGINEIQITLQAASEQVAVLDDLRLRVKPGA